MQKIIKMYRNPKKTIIHDFIFYLNIHFYKRNTYYEIMRKS